MAELDIPGVAMNQEYRVKLGKSFTFPKENAFHTIKCKTRRNRCVLYLTRIYSAVWTQLFYYWN